jgi:hypothetical protein
LGCKVEIITLPGRAFIPLLLEVIGDRLIVGEDDEMACFQHVAEMLYGLVYGQQLVVLCAIFSADPC